MKFLIASDIHGSAFYCDLLLKAIEDEKADRVLILGDILYHGPRNDLPKDYAPKKVIERLNPLKEKLLCIRGNCDRIFTRRILQKCRWTFCGIKCFVEKIITVYKFDS